MKRHVYSNSVVNERHSEFITDNSKIDVSPDDNSMMVYEADPDFFDTYCSELFASGLDCTDKRCKARIVARIRRGGYNAKRFEVSTKCPVSDEGLSSLINDLKDSILDYFDNLADNKSYRAELKSQGMQKMSAVAYTHYRIKKEFGVSPTFYYSDTQKSQYMLYDLPFTDVKNHVIHVAQGEQLAQQFEDLMDRLEADYGIYNDYSLPLGGSFVRGCWTIKTYGPDVIVDRKTKSVIEVVN